MSGVPSNPGQTRRTEHYSSKGQGTSKADTGLTVDLVDAMLEAQAALDSPTANGTRDTDTEITQISQSDPLLPNDNQKSELIAALVKRDEKTVLSLVNAVLGPKEIKLELADLTPLAQRDLQDIELREVERKLALNQRTTLTQAIGSNPKELVAIKLIERTMGIVSMNSTIPNVLLSSVNLLLNELKKLRGLQ